jgi:hypothetical protein
MKRIGVWFFAVIIFLSSTHQLPAPIQEENPTPAAKQSTEPKHRNTNKTSEATSKSRAPSATPSPQLTNCKMFDGTWTGHYETGLFGDVQYTFVIAGSGTVVRESSKVGTFTWRAVCNGKTMTWDWKISNSGTVTFTLNPDGKTGLMHDKGYGGLLGIGAYDSIGIFQKMA